MKKIIIILARKKFMMCLFSLLFVFVVFASIAVIHICSGRNILDGKVIVVDAGHGGVDGGASNAYIKEKDINLDIALKLQKKLEGGGAKAIMTRSSDVELGISDRIDRSRYLNDLNARVSIINNSGANMFVSIHANASRKNPSARGAIAFYNNSHPHNREMAYIFQNLFNTSGFEYNSTIYKSHHVPQKGEYYLLTNAKIPGIIVETGFITSSTDLMLLKKQEYRQYMADTIYQGIINYIGCCHNLPDKIDDTLDIEEEHVIDMANEDMEH